MRNVCFVIVCAALTLAGCSRHGPAQYVPYAKPQAQALSIGGLTEFQIPTAASHPQGITVGPDGNLWFVETSGNKIGRITTAGAITEFAIPTPNSQPLVITPGLPSNWAGGSLWFTEYAGNKIAEITTSGAISEHPIPTPNAGAYGIMFDSGPGHTAWFTESKANKIGRYESLQFAEFIVPVAASGPRTLLFGPDSQVWFAESNSNSIGRITHSGAISQIPADGPQRFLATAGDGAVWFTDAAHNRIGRITRSNRLQTFSISAGAGPGFITNGPWGNPWFTNFTANTLQNVDVTTHSVSSPLPVSGAPDGIVLGPDGNLWFTEYSGNKIGRLSVAAPIVRITAAATGATVDRGTVAAGPEGAMYFRSSGRGARYFGGAVKYELPSAPQCPSTTVLCPYGADADNITAIPSGVPFLDYDYWDGHGTTAAHITGTLQRFNISGSALTQSAVSNAKYAPGDLAADDRDDIFWTGMDGLGYGVQTLYNPNGGYLSTSRYYGFRFIAIENPARYYYPYVIERRPNGDTALASFFNPVYPEAIIGNDTVAGITAGPDGNIWLTDQTRNSIVRVNATTYEQTFYPIPTPSSRPTKIVSGYDGALWFTENGARKIGRITTSGRISEYAITIPGGQPYGIAVPPRGANCSTCPIWFSMPQGLGYITY